MPANSETANMSSNDLRRRVRTTVCKLTMMMVGQIFKSCLVIHEGLRGETIFPDRLLTGEPGR
jgi:hypothetical protein